MEDRLAWTRVSRSLLDEAADPGPTQGNPAPVLDEGLGVAEGAARGDLVAAVIGFQVWVAHSIAVACAKSSGSNRFTDSMGQRSPVLEVRTDRLAHLHVDEVIPEVLVSHGIPLLLASVGGERDSNHSRTLDGPI